MSMMATHTQVLQAGRPQVCNRASRRHAHRVQVSVLVGELHVLKHSTSHTQGHVNLVLRRIKPACTGRRAVRCRAAATAVETVKLADLELNAILDAQGLIQPEVPEGALACVFAIYDDKQRLQYVGFSKELRGTLRTVFSRRPDKAYFFRAHHLSSVDQPEMIRIRDSWFEQSGGPPNGNKLAFERGMWQQPVDAGAISQRGKLGAAEEKLSQLLAQIKARGCKEEFVPNTTLMLDGQVDFLPVAALTKEEVEKRKAEAAALQKFTRTSSATVDGVQRQFTIFYKRKFPTNGGYMIDLILTGDNQETEHRVIIGKDYYESNGAEVESVVEATFAVLLGQKLPRHTEGMLLNSQFPINYFSISEAEQWFVPEFAAEYQSKTGLPLPGQTTFWRFNRIHDYGPSKTEDPKVIGYADRDRGIVMPTR